MSTMLYKATLGLGKLTSCADRTLKEAWLYATGLKRLERRYGSARLPDGIALGVAMPVGSAISFSCFGGAALLLGAWAGKTELINAGIDVLVYGGGVPLAASLGILNVYSSWKAGRHDYRLEQREQAAALPAPSPQRRLVLK